MSRDRNFVLCPRVGAAKKDVLALQDSNKRATQALQASNLRVKELEETVQQLTSKLHHLEEQLREQRSVSVSWKSGRASLHSQIQERCHLLFIGGRLAILRCTGQGGYHNPRVKGGSSTSGFCMGTSVH